MNRKDVLVVVISVICSHRRVGVIDSVCRIDRGYYHSGLPEGWAAWSDTVSP